MATATWVGSTRSGNATGVSLMTTELNSLASGSGVLSSAIDNNLGDLYADLELVVTFGTAPAAGAPINVYIGRTVDGSNFENAAGGAAEIAPLNGYVGSFYVRAVTTAQRMIVPQVMIPPRDFVILLVNEAGQAFAATANTIKAYFYNYKAA